MTMGREIRRVPPNYQHPTDEYGRHIPQLDETFEEAAAEWKRRFAAWEAGERESHFNSEDDCEFWEWEGDPPQRETRRTYKTEDATWFQMYETVSEGTPVTPPFATLAELETYLADNGTFWDQKDYKEGISRRAPAWGRERAAAFCRSGHEVSMTIMRTPEGATEIVEPRDSAYYREQNRK